MRKREEFFFRVNLRAKKKRQSLKLFRLIVTYAFLLPRLHLQLLLNSSVFFTALPLYRKDNLHSVFYTYLFVVCLDSALEQLAMNYSHRGDHLDDEDGELDTFLAELGRLQEASRQRTAELQCAQEDEAALEREVAALECEMQMARQATLEAELTLLRSELSSKRSTYRIDSSRALLEDVERRRGALPPLPPPASFSANTDGGTRPLSPLQLDASPAASLEASLRILSQHPFLRREYIKPLAELLQQLLSRYQHLNPNGVPVDDASGVGFAAFRSWLVRFIPSVPFTEEEWIVLQFLSRGSTDDQRRTA